MQRRTSIVAWVLPVVASVVALATSLVSAPSFAQDSAETPAAEGRPAESESPDDPDAPAAGESEEDDGERDELSESGDAQNDEAPDEPEAPGRDEEVAETGESTESGEADADRSTADEAWRETFDLDDVPLIESGARYVVVTARGPEAAGEALRRAISLTDAKLAVSGRDFADMTGLSDEKILERLQNAPVDRAAVLRVSPDEQPPTAIVTIYEKDGTSVGGFTATRGRALDPSQVAVGSGDEGPDAAETTSPDRKPSSDTSARQRYALRNYDRGWVLRDRKRDESYRGEAIYAELGYADLRSRYAENISRRNRRTTTAVLMVSGGVLASGIGGYLTYRSYFPILDDSAPSSGPCAEIENDRVRQNCRIDERRKELVPMRVAGFTAMAAGLGGMVGSLFFLPTGSPHPISFDDLVRRINRTNARPEETGSTGEEGSSETGESEAADPDARLDLLPVVSLTTPGLVLRIRF